VTRAIDDGPLQHMAISCDAQREDGAFVMSGGARMTVSHPFAATALDELCERWPASLTLPELAACAAARLGRATDGSDSVAVLRDLLLHAYVVQGVRLLGCALPAGRPGPRPAASPLARAQAARGEPVVSTLLPDNHRIADDAQRRLLVALDGSRDIHALARALGRNEAPLREALDGLAGAGLLAGA
jgi:hypothetical protein